MPQLGPLEILVIFVVALLVFGPSKLPEIGRQVGKGVNEFRKFQHSLREDLDGMLGGHDDQSDAATAAPTLPPRTPPRKSSARLQLSRARPPRTRVIRCCRSRGPTRPRRLRRPPTTPRRPTGRRSAPCRARTPTAA